MTTLDDYTPYCGLKNDDRSRHVKVESGPHVCISAPTGTGKTRRIFAPAAIMHPGPVFNVSAKPDQAKMIFQRRVGGVRGVLDFSPHGGTEVWPADVRNMFSDPTASIRTAQEALTVAETMLATGGVGFGGASGGSTVSAGGLWEATASAPLAALLYAASPRGNGEGMPWVIEAAENYGMPDPNEAESDTRAAALTAPEIPPISWMAASLLCPHRMLTEPLLSMLAMDPRMRDSVAITARKAIKPWLRLGLTTSSFMEDDELEQLEVQRLDLHSFELDMLDDPTTTISVIAPNTGSVAGVAVALVDSVIRYFERKAANDMLSHLLLLQLGEVCNSCPLPALINYVGAARGLGVRIMAEVQASSQFDHVYGPKYAEALRDIFPAFLIMRGAHERHILEQASHWEGLATRRTEAYEPHSGSQGQSSVFGPAFEWQEFLPRDLNEARLIVRGTGGEKVWIPDWSDFLPVYDKAVNARIARMQGKKSLDR
ncbi:type IV secretory pathway, VirD4 component [Mycobacteroides abscessus subsp. bolletii]|uniref:TraM recognition domain-containing protein n=1 Tax=Mycobacteroides abscessus TaxID=36809 RepID=UPI0009A8F26E|nr:TraM recognition domain-containing protein [Mycobacteroides abscessus]SKS73535.1 type IV secretory pathway, VirD4 component [Mycobacteroides abscessus subsp. bolletii]SKS83268.1 type IV secretory pathway, VirD4 component [Mycobacteroides abscessus subsp. bolletii]